MGANTVEAVLPDPIQELADRLTASFAESLTASVVREVVQACYEPLREARIANYVPILVEHNSRAELRQLIRHTAPSGPPLRERSGRTAGPSVTTALRGIRKALTRAP
jgi:hypothetical protein